MCHSTLLLHVFLQLHPREKLLSAQVTLKVKFGTKWLIITVLLWAIIRTLPKPWIGRYPESCSFCVYFSDCFSKKSFLAHRSHWTVCGYCLLRDLSKPTGSWQHFVYKLIHAVQISKPMKTEQSYPTVSVWGLNSREGG